MTEKKSLNDFFIQTFISDVFSLIQYEKIYSRLMSFFLCCPLISCQCDSGHMKVVIHFDLRPVLVSMPYVPSWNCGRPPGSVPARTGPTVASCGTGCANQRPFPAQSQAAVLWVVGTYKETAYPNLSKQHAISK